MSAVVADSYDLRRWSLSAAVVISLHAALVVMLTTSHERMPGDEGTEAIIVDLSPVAAPPTDSRNDLAPGPEQQQSKSTRDVQQPEQDSAGKNRADTSRAGCGGQTTRGGKAAEKTQGRYNAAGSRDDIAATTQAVRRASRVLVSQDCAASRAAQRLSGIRARAARDRRCRTRIHTRPIRKGRDQPARADVGLCGPRSGNDGYCATCTAISIPTPEHAR